MKIEEYVPLAEKTTFRIGGAARYYCDVVTTQDLIEAVAFAKAKSIPVFILGAGSNILIADSGYAGLVLHINMTGITWEEEGTQTLVSAGAGLNWDKFVEETVNRGYWGIENLSGIPGSIGASVVQNIGAYGVEVSEVVETVEVYDRSKEKVRTLSRDACAFGYRDSVWKHDEGKDLIVLAVTYRLQKEGHPRIAYKDLGDYFARINTPNPSQTAVRDALLTIRSHKFPDLATHGTAGSFFKNPVLRKADALPFITKFPDAPCHDVGEGMVKLSAGWIIDHALNMRGIREGMMGTWPAQALVMVNYGGAHAGDAEHFAKEIQRRAKEELDIVLEPEVIFVKS